MNLKNKCRDRSTQQGHAHYLAEAGTLALGQREGRWPSLVAIKKAHGFGVLPWTRLRLGRGVLCASRGGSELLASAHGEEKGALRVRDGVLPRPRSTRVARLRRPRRAARS